MLLTKSLKLNTKQTPELLQKLVIKCDSCDTVFSNRTYYSRQNLLKKHKKDLCVSCANKKAQANPKLRQIHRENGLKRVNSMTKQERKDKYGHDYWKKCEKWIENSKSSEGHGEKVSQYMQSLTKEERAKIHGRPGKLNPMYGRPAPIGSGIGFSGWYNNIFFRSTLELSFLLKHPTAISAEKLVSIPYKNEKGMSRTYHPDFIIDDNFVVELKPKKLWPANKKKFICGAKWCKDNNMVYKVFSEKEYPCIRKKELKRMAEKNIITLTESTLKRLYK